MTIRRGLLIAVDFDGVIVPDVYYPNKIPTEFMPGAKEALLRIADEGHRLMLWTARDCGNSVEHEPLRIALTFLLRYKIPISLPRHVFGFSYPWKVPADLYIEDKIPGGFVGWDFILESLGLGDGKISGWTIHK